MASIRKLAEGVGFKTHVRVTPKPDFESGAFNHSATLPLRGSFAAVRSSDAPFPRRSSVRAKSRSAAKPELRRQERPRPASSPRSIRRSLCPNPRGRQVDLPFRGAKLPGSALMNLQSVLIVICGSTQALSGEDGSASNLPTWSPSFMASCGVSANTYLSVHALS